MILRSDSEIAILYLSRISPLISKLRDQNRGHIVVDPLFLQEHLHGTPITTLVHGALGVEVAFLVGLFERRVGGAEYGLSNLKTKLAPSTSCERALLVG